MQLGNVTSGTKARSRRRIGRGGKRGKTSGRGMKGQKSRAGAKIRPELRDMIKKLPKLRGRGIHGLKSIQMAPAVVNLADLEGAFRDGEVVSPKTLVEKGLIARYGGRLPSVKILGTGKLKKNITISDCALSENAKERIKKAGGTVE